MPPPVWKLVVQNSKLSHWWWQGSLKIFFCTMSKIFFVLWVKLYSCEYSLCLNFFPTTFIPKACKIFSKYFICKKKIDTNISSWKYFINICSKGYKAAYLAKDVRRVMLVSTVQYSTVKYRTVQYSIVQSWKNHDFREKVKIIKFFKLWVLLQILEETGWVQPKNYVFLNFSNSASLFPTLLKLLCFENLEDHHF